MFALAARCTTYVPIPWVKRKGYVLLRGHRAVAMLTTGAGVIEEGLPLVAATYRGRIAQMTWGDIALTWLDKVFQLRRQSNFAHRSGGHQATDDVLSTSYSSSWNTDLD